MASNENKTTCGAGFPGEDVKAGVPLLFTDNLSFSFGGTQPVFALRDVSFGVEQGHVAAIIGESGSGKSTLLKLIYGLLEPTEGETRHAGVRVPGPGERLIPGHPAMRLVSQNFDDLNTYAKAWDNVASRLSNVDIEAKAQKTQAMLEALRISHRAQHRVFDLSGGEKQRVAIARALVDGTTVLLLDEPFNQVDASFREQLQQDIRRIVDSSGLTVVMVSHDPDEVMAMADQLLVLREGKLVANGAPADLYNHPPNAYTARLLARSNIVSVAEARALGLQADRPLAVHPEWIVVSAESGIPAEVETVLFRGFYEEVIVRAKGVRLKAVALERGRYRKGQHVGLEFSRTHPVS